MSAAPPLLAFHGVSREFWGGRGFGQAVRAVRAVREVSLELFPGRTLGIVGESGSGKSTLGRMAVGLLPPSSGDVRVNGCSLYGQEGGNRPPAGVAQMIFQDPYSSLNPRMRVGRAVEEPLLWSRTRLSSQERMRRVAAILEQVGLDGAQARRYPHEFSGGQRQRVAIARALVSRPAFVVCDEPTSSLDASVQAQILNLLKDMQESMGLAYLFISHDLAVVRHMADQVAVMYQGWVVEEADARDLFREPLHPYARLLLGEGSGGEVVPLPGISAASGDLCPFLARCPESLPRCRIDPVPSLPSGGGHRARCLRL